MTGFVSPSLALDHYPGTWYLSHGEECAVKQLYLRPKGPLPVRQRYR